MCEGLFLTQGRASEPHEPVHLATDECVGDKACSTSLLVSTLSVFLLLFPFFAVAVLFAIFHPRCAIVRDRSSPGGHELCGFS